MGRGGERLVGGSGPLRVRPRGGYKLQERTKAADEHE